MTDVKLIIYNNGLKVFKKYHHEDTKVTKK